MKKLFLIIQMALATGLLFAGNGNNTVNKKENKGVPAEAAVVISGKVTDEVTGEALTGVKVTIDGLSIKAYTDFDGNFRFEQLLPGEYSLTATYVSYDRKQVHKINPVKEDRNLEISLKSSH